MKIKIAVLLVLLAMGGSLFAQSQVGGGGGGIASVASLPATCTPGTTANVTLSVFPFQEWQCGPQINTWYPFNPKLTVNPLSFGAKWDVKAVIDCPFTNASNVVTCPTGEAQFTSADLGKIVFGTSFPGALTTGCSGATCGSVLIPQGFICTINSADSISIGTTFPGCAADNATAGCTVVTTHPTTNCALIWGTQDDSTAIQNAALAAWTGNSCKTLEFPAGMAFFTVPSGGLLYFTIPAGSPCAGFQIADATQTGPQIAGQGGSNSLLVPLPSVNFANCTGGNSGIGCVAPPRNTFTHDWGIWGFGQSGSGTTNAHNLFELAGTPTSCTATAAWNMSFADWQEASTSSKGFVVQGGCGVLYASNIVSEGFGNTNCSFVPGNTITVSGMDCFGSSGAAIAGSSLELNLSSGSTFNSTGSLYWGVNTLSANGQSAVKINGTGVGGVYNSFSDGIIGANNANNNYALYIPTGSATVFINLSGSYIQQSNSGATTTSSIFCQTGNVCNINAYSSKLTASGTHQQLFRNLATINFFDACGNTFTQGSIASDAINIFGSCSITGTTITAAKLVLSAGWGTTAAWTGLSGSTQQVFGTITASGTGQAANPTITYTFPTPFLQTPTGCFALQLGGTQAGVAIPFTPSALTATGVTFTYNGTPVAGNTLVVQIQCWNP